MTTSRRSSKNKAARGRMDSLIATRALDENLILVIHNTQHFEMAPGLRVEDWMV
jgi:predicted nucleic acid-binding protein